MTSRDLPFSFAVTAAVIFHVSLVVILRWNPVVASPSAAPVPQPIVVRFVESPSNALAVPEKPNTEYRSDANRKAGSPEAKERQSKTKIRRPGPPVAAASPPRRPSRTVSRPPVRAPAASMESDSSSTASVSEDGTIPVAPKSAARNADLSPPNNPPQLAQSLRNLDQYIQAGTGSQTGNVPEDTGSGVFFDTQGYDLGPWANRIVSIVRGNWLIPLAAQMGNKGIVSISFKIDRSGKVMDIKVVQKSGTPSFDQAAVNALRSSSPLPPLPADFPRPHLPAVFRFYYNTPVPD